MGYAKERGKLEKLSEKIVGLAIYSEKSLAILLDSHDQYSHTIRILKNKNPEAFGELYTVDLPTLKEGKKLLKESETEEARQAAFLEYKTVIKTVLDKAIEVTKLV
ncbi:hypothetical protein [Pedobacter sp. GR22-6]|uniref:hypothetical protein n=1 Tax=Pedobacter sp. GR22-6 TaxID=3127957 RepID=UPI00307E3B80